MPCRARGIESTRHLSRFAISRHLCLAVPIMFHFLHFLHFLHRTAAAERNVVLTFFLIYSAAFLSFFLSFFMWRCAVVVGRWRLQLGELSQSNQRLELSSTRLDETQRRLDSRLGVISKFFSSLLRSDGPDARSPGLCQQAEGRRIFAFLLRPFFSLFLLSLRSLLTLPASLEFSQSILFLSILFSSLLAKVM